MLETLRIRNIAIIDSAEIPFRAGMNVLSGETGAGKSIILEAISLLLGSRANSELIRSGCEEAVVEGFFRAGSIPWIQGRLETLGFPATSDGSDGLLIKRTVHRAGRHRITINGELATLSALQKLCDGLIDLCGQHEHQSLLRPSVQLELLDRYGSLTEPARAVSEAFSALRALKQELSQLSEAEAERTRRADFLKFQIEELKGAELAPGEDEKLHLEKQLLQSAEARLNSGESLRSFLEAEDEGILNLLRGALLKAKALQQLDERASSLREGVERALAEAEEVSLSLSRYLASVDMDEGRLEAVQARLSLLADLRRKYGQTVEEMLATLDALEQEYASLAGAEERVALLAEQISASEEELRKAGTKLTSARKKAAKLFSTSVSGELKDLRMSEATFEIELLTEENPSQWSGSGPDTASFRVKTNAGEPAKALGKIASGGELSRLMLAIRRVISDKGGIGVYLFDEIDAGIGGQTAFQVGKKLKSVAAFNQIICITHLPQVASFADHHLVVRKVSSGKRTVTEVFELTGKSQRKEELARMLGGPELTKKSLENAAELLDLAR